MSIIEIKNLTKIYRRRHLGMLKETVGICDLNLSIQEGEIFALLGLNGAGKTTTLKLVVGLLRPTKGEVFIRGSSFRDYAIRKDLGYLPELPYFYRYLTAYEILSIYAQLSGLPKKEIKDKVEKMLNLVGLEKEGKRRLSEFSRGMLQRVGIAQALIHNPSILVLDEPVSGLDPVGIREMRTLILNLKKEGKTILLSSHIISEVERISDRVGIIHKNKLIAIWQQEEWIKGNLEEMFVEKVRAEKSE
jgi:ABC-2 type transport system ATP-binding protein